MDDCKECGEAVSLQLEVCLECIRAKGVAVVKRAFAGVLAVTGEEGEAQHKAQSAACVLADLLQELSDNFDSDRFFRDCCLDKQFIARMRASREAFEREQAAKGRSD